MTPYTVIIKSFLRPQKVKACVESVRQHTSAAEVIVVDDGDIDLPQLDAKVIRLPFDSGISAGRNTGVIAASTAYVVILDDDFVVNEDHPFDSAAYCMRDWDILTFRILNPRDGSFKHWASNFYLRNSTLHRQELAPNPSLLIQPCHMGLNCFIARRQSLIDNPWDSRLKVGEHWDFFYRFPGRVGLFQKGYVIHTPKSLNPRYNKFRARVKTFLPLALAKHKLDRYVP